MLNDRGEWILLAFGPMRVYNPVKCISGYIVGKDALLAGHHS